MWDKNDRGGCCSSRVGGAGFDGRKLFEKRSACATATATATGMS